MATERIRIRDVMQWESKQVTSLFTRSVKPGLVVEISTDHRWLITSIPESVGVLCFEAKQYI